MIGAKVRPGSRVCSMPFVVHRSAQALVSLCHPYLASPGRRDMPRTKSDYLLSTRMVSVRLGENRRAFLGSRTSTRRSVPLVPDTPDLRFFAFGPVREMNPSITRARQG